MNQHGGSKLFAVLQNYFIMERIEKNMKNRPIVLSIRIDETGNITSTIRTNYWQLKHYELTPVEQFRLNDAIKRIIKKYQIK